MKVMGCWYAKGTSATNQAVAGFRASAGAVIATGQHSAVLAISCGRGTPWPLAAAACATGVYEPRLNVAGETSQLPHPRGVCP